MKKHKRYILFGYDKYYPGGGMEDIIGSFDTVDDAKKAIKEDDSDKYDLLDTVDRVKVEV